MIHLTNVLMLFWSSKEQLTSQEISQNVSNYVQDLGLKNKKYKIKIGQINKNLKKKLIKISQLEIYEPLFNSQDRKELVKSLELNSLRPMANIIVQQYEIINQILKDYQKNFSKEYLAEGNIKANTLSGYKKIQKEMINSFTNLILKKAFFELEEPWNLNFDLLSDLLFLRVSYQTKPSLSINSYISAKEFEYFQKIEAIPIKKSKNEKNIKQDENFINDIKRTLELFHEGNISEELARKILKIQSQSLLDQFLEEFVNQDLSSEKFARTISRSLAVVSVSADERIQQMVRDLVENLGIGLRMSITQIPILQLTHYKMWLLLLLTKYGVCSPHFFINILLDLLNLFSKPAMELLTDLLEREFYFLIKEPSSQERFQYFITELRAKNCPNIACNQAFNRLMRVVQNILRLNDLRDMSHLESQQKEQILAKLSTRENIYASKTQIIEDFFFETFSHCGASRSVSETLSVLLSLPDLRRFTIEFARQFINYLRVKKKSQAPALIGLLKELQVYYPFVVHFARDKFCSFLLNLFNSCFNDDKQNKTNLSADLVLFEKEGLLSEIELLKMLHKIRKADSRRLNLWWKVSSDLKSQISLLYFLRQICKNERHVQQLVRLQPDKLLDYLFHLPTLKNYRPEAESPDLDFQFQAESLFRFEILTRVLKLYSPEKGYSPCLFTFIIEFQWDLHLYRKEESLNSYLEFGSFDVMKKMLKRVGQNDFKSFLNATKGKKYKDTLYEDIIRELFVHYEKYIVCLKENKNVRESRSKPDDVDTMYLTKQLFNFIEQSFLRTQSSVEKRPQTKKKVEEIKIKKIVQKEEEEDNEGLEEDLMDEFEKEMNVFLEEQAGQGQGVGKKVDFKINALKFSKKKMDFNSNSGFIIISRPTHKKIQTRVGEIVRKSKHAQFFN